MPTRTSANSESLIDHIICSKSEKISLQGNIPLGISDHDVIYCIRHSNKNFPIGHNTIKIRALRNYNSDIFKQKLHDEDWSPLYKCTDVNDAWLVFKVIFTKVLDSITPLKDVRIKSNSEPWMSYELLDKMRIRDNCFFFYFFFIFFFFVTIGY